MARFQQGLYVPKNPEKYVGDVTIIRYMSSWELSMHKFLDNNIRILKWSSETIAIPYIKPTDNKIHKYYPDYFVEYVDKSNKIRRIIIEVKPHAQTRKTRARSEKNRLYENIQYSVNLAKWAAAKDFCTQHGLEFQIVTEKNMFS